MEIRSKIEKFCPNVNKNFHGRGACTVRVGGKPETQNKLLDLVVEHGERPSNNYNKRSVCDVT